MSDFMDGLQNCAEAWLMSNMRTPKRHKSCLLQSDDDTRVTAGSRAPTFVVTVNPEDV